MTLALFIGSLLMGCVWSESGGILYAVNEWDDDVIVRIESGSAGWRLGMLPVVSENHPLRVSSTGEASLVEGTSIDSAATVEVVENYEETFDADERCPLP
jgi:hypothetical protein